MSLWTMVARDRVSPVGVWQEVLGGEFAGFRRAFLTPVQGLSPTYLCGNERSVACGAYLVEQNEKGEFVGLCETGECEPVRLEHCALARLELDKKKVCEVLGRVLGLQGEVKELGGRVWSVGSFHPHIHEKVSVGVVFPEQREAGGESYLRAMSLLSAPGMVGYPAELGPSEEISQAASKNKIALFALEEVVDWHGGRLVLRGNWKILKDKYVEKAIDARDYRPEGPKKYPTPLGAKWEDVRMRFQNGHEVLIKVGSEEEWSRWSYKDMGLADKRSGKTVAGWRMLKEFAEKRGGPIQTVENEIEKGGIPERRVKELNEALRVFFGIEGKAIVFRRGRQWGYETQFRVEPEGEEGRANRNFLGVGEKS